MTLLKFTDVSLAYGAMPLLDKVSWQIARGERVCIIGRNGTGKSSMLRLVKGEQKADDGVIWRAPALKIGELPQELPRADERTVFDVVAEGLSGVGELLARAFSLPFPGPVVGMVLLLGALRWPLVREPVAACANWIRPFTSPTA